MLILCRLPHISQAQHLAAVADRSAVVDHHIAQVAISPHSAQLEVPKKITVRNIWRPLEAAPSRRLLKIQAAESIGASGYRLAQLALNEHAD
jgi:hypothetical protein